MSSKTREVTNKLLEMMDSREIDPKALAKCCLGYMSERDVRDMAEGEGYIEDEDEAVCTECGCGVCECDEYDNDDCQPNSEDDS